MITQMKLLVVLVKDTLITVLVIEAFMQISRFNPRADFLRMNLQKQPGIVLTTLLPLIWITPKAKLHLTDRTLEGG